jgi:hypothetical protein
MPSNSPAKVRILLLLILGPVLRVTIRVPFGWIGIYAGVLVRIVEGIRHISVLGNNLVADLDVMAADITPESRPSRREPDAFPETHFDCGKFGLPGRNRHGSQLLNHGSIGICSGGTRTDCRLDFGADFGHPLRVEREEDEDPGGVDARVDGAG